MFVIDSIEYVYFGRVRSLVLMVEIMSSFLSIVYLQKLDNLYFPFSAYVQSMISNQNIYMPFLSYTIQQKIIGVRH